ncbi:unnamed protein product [Prorocentrum cordatum]|uniref:Uncharacterized protein n=1 Tax=Prorocentrum cordatum TaxID=2364126 RepID=A0ABN9S6F4_9DINO|nr:unnamed protein product [Polarella glacialis]
MKSCCRVPSSSPTERICAHPPLLVLAPHREAPPAEGAIAGTIPEAPAIADAAPADAAPADAAAAPADAAPASAAPDDATMEPAGGAGAAVAEAPSAASAADAPADAAPAAAVEIDGEAGQQTSTAGKRSADTAGVVAEPEAKKAKT